MHVSALIACRMGSSRLPGKSMKPILGKPMVEQMIERVMRSRYVKEVTIATTNLPDDQPLFELAQKNGISC